MGEVYQPKNKVRFVTAASLFDGHDAAINIIRRLLQLHGAEVIHLGHNRSVREIVDAAIQEDVQGIAVSSYQGGHMEFFTYMVDLLRQRGAGYVRVFGGGGGVIVPEEIRQLEAYGVAKIFSPEDGRRLGLEGMISLMLESCDFAVAELTNGQPPDLSPSHWQAVARAISQIEAGKQPSLPRSVTKIPVVGITGVGGAGKSSLTDELVRRLLMDFPSLQVAILAVDPTKRRTGGALLADRIRMNSLASDRVYMRSLATRQAHRSLSAAVEGALQVVETAGFHLAFVESAGAGQADSEIADLADVAIYTMTPEYGASLQLEKIDMLDFAHLVAINKFDRPGALDALREVRKQWRRSHPEFSGSEEELPVFGTCAHQFHDRGVNALYQALLRELEARFGSQFHLRQSHATPVGLPQRNPIIPAERSGYLREIAHTCRSAKNRAEEQVRLARVLYQLVGARAVLSAYPGDGGFQNLWQLFEAIVAGSLPPEPTLADLDAEIRQRAHQLAPESRALLATWPQLQRDYTGESFSYTVRDKQVTVPLTTLSLSGTAIPKVVLPKSEDWGEILQFLLRENVPGAYPYTAGVFPFKRQEELPTRMFAGEGGPERTNKRFHFLRAGQPFARLSTAFDSVTLYGEDPNPRPDVYGKVGEAGVSICTVEDMEKLYAGFDLCAPNTSVSMTINGPAPMILAMFFNVAGRQEAKRRLIAAGRLAGKPEDALKPQVNGQNWEQIAQLMRPGEWEEALTCAVQKVRGTVQADILKEDQAQNTCIFSTEFALRLMGDIQSWFVENKVRNFYSVSISGYHIAEAGANPITQLAFTLANGFTYVEYYRARGLAVDDFAPNLSFFFSNGMDPEYTVIGRVARRIWATAIREVYGGNERSQKLKYHIQTSGRSLHAKEIAFNDIRTTLQALLALADNCNSLHTNAYDEAITTPTEESVRRALAIQLISTLEFGLLKNENLWQGSYFIQWLTDQVEEAVFQEFERLAERGGVLGAMETGYQRAKIQEESLYYEKLKHSGALPIVGVNFFENPSKPEGELETSQLTRASKEEKDLRLAQLQDFHARHRFSELWEKHRSGPIPNPELDVLPPWERPADYALARLQQVARAGGNLFAELLETVCSCSLGQITHALYQVGGQYRRNM
ncbi:MAG: fused isobutyryl-CoA mutase/GTPase IcmF [Thermoanaerobaculaceae bacterium]